jgi:hypothetical protein
MKHRNLRIAWSVAWGLVAVFLCILCVRSYWYADQLWIPLPAKHALGFISAANRATVAIQKRVAFSPTEYFTGFSSDPLKHIHQYRARSYAGFSAGNEGDSSFVRMPFWFLIAITAVVPFFSFHFSLRTLLIATTLVAVGLGLLVWAAK